jgi:uncharacterized MAPEG superfamily protein
MVRWRHKQVSTESGQAHLLVAALYGLAAMTAMIRTARRTVLNPEDVKVYVGSTVVALEHPDIQRVKRAHLNLLENAVPFFVIGLLYALTGPSLMLAGLLFFSFVAVRLLHAFFYLTARQPLRSAAFGVGGLVNLIMAVQVVRVVL